ncbi:MAG: alkaline phosphatase family protein, partial [Candidatus Hydrogenedentes bacterium]|nr:alkaline phosphatase family protein [Candidatus Hydrogenedentota bacterium]
MLFQGRFAYLLLLLSCVSLTVSGCSGSEEQQGGGASASLSSGAEGRVVILGFDGVEPTIVEQMMDAGELPNLAKLRDGGTYSRLQSSNPPQSPTAWSSFTTSKHPGNHGIYDFILRTPRNYLPGVGFGSVVHPKLAADGSLASPPGFKNLREGESFWKVASDQGARCKVFSVPFAFPADTLEEGCMLAGLGVPDLRGTTSTFWLMSDAFTEPEDISGGKKRPLNFIGETAKVEIEGARNPSTREYTTTTIEIRADREAKSLEIGLPDTTLSLKEGEWSAWVEWSCDVSPKYTVRAISRFHVL